jgi:glycosyltransferase involved in cell wall biosynthesis
MTRRLVGSGMPEAVKRLARPGIVIIGQIDDLLARVFDRVRLTIAPLRYGAGVKGKVLDSFAAGVPCVMTPVAAEGLDLPPALQDWVSDSPAGLAQGICRLHSEVVVNTNVAASGLAYIEQGFGEDLVADALLRAIEGRRPEPPKAT